MKYILVSLLALLVLTVPSMVSSYASTGMSNCTLDPDREDCNEQPDRVGNDGGGDSTDADRDGPGGDDGPRQTDDDDTGEANCWGKVTSSLTKTTTVSQELANIQAIRSQAMMTMKLQGKASGTSKRDILLITRIKSGD